MELIFSNFCQSRIVLNRDSLSVSDANESVRDARMQYRENRQRLKTGILKLIQTGAITTKHRQQIEAFAVRGGASLKLKVQATLAAEKAEVWFQAAAFEEALEDGILEPREEQ